MQQQKVWVIGEEDWKRPVRTIPDPKEPAVGERAAAEPARFNPALAFSLSLLVWGGGQFYLRQAQRAVTWLAGMTLVGSQLFLLAYFFAPLGRKVAAGEHQLAVLVVGCLLLLAIPLLWLGNAVDAYRQAVQANARPFAGVSREHLPPLAAFFLPGWGQFLNGQPKKGSAFLMAGALGFSSALLLWSGRLVAPWFTAGTAHQAFEWALLLALGLLLFSGLVWMVGVFDSIRVSRDLFRKKFSLKNVGFWAWVKELLRDLLPSGTAILGLLLAISVGMQLFPRDYYLKLFDHLQLEMARQHLDFLAGLVRTAGNLLGR